MSETREQMAARLDAATLRAVRVDLRRELNALVPHDNSPYAIGFDNGVLWAIDRVAALDAAAPRPVACKHGDPACPCQDGDPCHYKDTATTKAMMPPDDRAGERSDDE